MGSISGVPCFGSVSGLGFRSCLQSQAAEDSGVERFRVQRALVLKVDDMLPPMLSAVLPKAVAGAEEINLVSP